MQSTPQKGAQKLPHVTTSPGQTPMKSPETKKPKGQELAPHPEVEPTIQDMVEAALFLLLFRTSGS